MDDDFDNDDEVYGIEDEDEYESDTGRDEDDDYDEIVKLSEEGDD